MTEIEREIPQAARSVGIGEALMRAVDSSRGDRVALAHLYAAMESARRDLAVALDEVAHLFHEAMGEDRAVVVEGVGLVEATWSSNRTAWRNDELWREVVRLAAKERAVDLETGEIESEPQAALRVLGSCARPSWRVSALKSRGVAVDEFCSTTRKRSVRVH